MKSYTINLHGKLYSIERPWVMGILNTTQDSFFSGGRSPSLDDALQKAEQMLSSGADIIDIGGQSTRPGAERIPAEIELARAIPIVEAIHKNFPDALLSIDTFYASVSREAVAAGASMVNDISAGRIDPELIPTVAELGVPYVLMHMKGEPKEMQKAPVYENTVSEVISFLSYHVNQLRQAGINDIILDPGFGFGKNTAHNYSLLRHLNELNILGCPILAGISRKKMIQTIVGTPSPDEALTGTIAANTLALVGGASILRVHDVKEATETVRIFMEWDKSA